MDDSTPLDGSAPPSDQSVEDVAASNGFVSKVRGYCSKVKDGVAYVYRADGADLPNLSKQIKAKQDEDEDANVEPERSAMCVLAIAQAALLGGYVALTAHMCAWEFRLGCEKPCDYLSMFGAGICLAGVLAKIGLGVKNNLDNYKTIFTTKGDFVTVPMMFLSVVLGGITGNEIFSYNPPLGMACWASFVYACRNVMQCVGGLNLPIFVRNIGNALATVESSVATIASKVNATIS
jgi:hypothetical protein